MPERSLLLLVIGVLVGTTLTISALERPAVVSAHCPGTAAHDYAYGWQIPGVNINGVVGTIEWTQGNVCTSGVSHSVTVCTASCGKWAQAGWRYYSYMSEPRMYCEWGGGSYLLKEFFPLTHVTHSYKMAYDTYDRLWDCYLDGAGKWSYGSAGFTIGTYLNAQGENHQTHVQIGKMAPAKLLFSVLQYRKVSDVGWSGMNITPVVTSGPYGADEPSVGQLRVWTNAH